MDEFKFLPTFFITYMVGQDVSRWLQWLRTMFSVQGRLHDVTLLVASSYRKLNDPVTGGWQGSAPEIVQAVQIRMPSTTWPTSSWILG